MSGPKSIPEPLIGGSVRRGNAGFDYGD
jgi:hypothetical protein